MAKVNRSFATCNLENWSPSIWQNNLCLQVPFLLQLWSCNVYEVTCLKSSHSLWKLFVIPSLATQGLSSATLWMTTTPGYRTLVKTFDSTEGKTGFFWYDFPILQLEASELKVCNVSINFEEKETAHWKSEQQFLCYTPNWSYLLIYLIFFCSFYGKELFHCM